MGARQRLLVTCCPHVAPPRLASISRSPRQAGAKWRRARERRRKEGRKKGAVSGRAGERERLSETERMSKLKSGICLFKFNHAALAELEMDGLRYEFLIRRLIGYERGRNPIEKAFFPKQGQAITALQRWLFALPFLYFFSFS